MTWSAIFKSSWYTNCMITTQLNRPRAVNKDTAGTERGRSGLVLLYRQLNIIIQSTPPAYTNNQQSSSMPGSFSRRTLTRPWLIIISSTGVNIVTSRWLPRADNVLYLGQSITQAFSTECLFSEIELFPGYKLHMHYISNFYTISRRSRNHLEGFMINYLYLYIWLPLFCYIRWPFITLMLFCIHSTNHCQVVDFDTTLTFVTKHCRCAPAAKSR